jgi:hypothetical protein
VRRRQTRPTRPPRRRAPTARQRPIDAARAAEADRLDGLDSSAFQQVPKVRTEKAVVAESKFLNFRPDVTGLSVLVLDTDVPTVMGEVGKPSLPGGVEGQRLTIISTGTQPPIFTDQADMKFVGNTWSGTKGDNVTLVLANGVWHETARANLP